MLRNGLAFSGKRRAEESPSSENLGPAPERFAWTAAVWADSATRRGSGVLREVVAWTNSTGR